MTKAKEPKMGESVTVLGRTLTKNPDGTIGSKMKGRPDLIHPNWPRAMDSINLAAGMVW
jgi:hypothetical protein